MVYENHENHENQGMDARKKGEAFPFPPTLSSLANSPRHDKKRARLDPAPFAFTIVNGQFCIYCYGNGLLGFDRGTPKTRTEACVPARRVLRQK